MQQPRRNGSIRALLVADEALFRALMKERLESSGRIEVVGEASSGEEAVQMARIRRPKVVVLDINLAGMGGVETTRLLKRVDGSVQVLALSPSVDCNVPLRLLAMGVNGYVSKACTPNELVHAVRDVHNGDGYLDTRVAREIVLDHVNGRTSPLDALTPRELEVMTWIAKGKRVTEIAQALSRSPKTISTLRSRIIRKLDVSTDVEITLVALRYRVVKLNFHC